VELERIVWAKNERLSLGRSYGAEALSAVDRLTVANANGQEFDRRGQSTGSANDVKAM
jgi:hypothetical protein